MCVHTLSPETSLPSLSEAGKFLGYYLVSQNILEFCEQLGTLSAPLDSVSRFLTTRSNAFRSNVTVVEARDTAPPEFEVKNPHSKKGSSQALL